MGKSWSKIFLYLLISATAIIISYFLYIYEQASNSANSGMFSNSSIQQQVEPPEIKPHSLPDKIIKGN